MAHFVHILDVILRLGNADVVLLWLECMNFALQYHNCSNTALSSMGSDESYYYRTDSKVPRTAAVMYMLFCHINLDAGTA